MSNEALYPVPPNFSDAHITPEKYHDMYRQSLEDPETFWSQQASEFLSWDKTWDRCARAIYPLATHAGSTAETERLSQLY